MKNLISAISLSLTLFGSALAGEPLPLANSVAVKNLDSIEKQILNKPVQIAEDLLKKEKIIYRIVKQDGTSFAVTMDYNPNRLNLEIEKKIVVQITRG